MRKSARFVALVVALAAVVPLAACATMVEPATPLTNAQRLAILDRKLDIDWARIARDFPDAVRPQVGAPVSVDPSQWVRKFSDCLVGSLRPPTGATVSDTVGAPWFGSVRSQRIAYFSCESRFPSPASFSGLLSRTQIGALYAYQVGFVRACLTSAGIDVGTIPSRADYLVRYDGGDRWTPFGALTDLPRSRFEALQRRCPENPAWLPGV